MQKHKINEALNQNFKTNQIRTKKKKKKKKKSKANPFGPRWGGGHALVGGEKRLSSSLCHQPTIFVCERESFLNALDQMKCQRRKEKRKVKIETREWCGREKKRKKEKKKRVDKK